MDRLAELRKVAEAATPGPWRLAGKATIRYGDKVASGWIADVAWRNREANATHIVAFDPPTVLLMLDALERAQHLRYCTEVMLGGAPHSGHTVATRKAVVDLRAALAGLESIRGRGEGK